MNPHHVKVDPKTVKIFHVNNKATFACEVNGQHQVVAFAESRVHPKDQFCRQTGRVKAIGRLQSTNYRTVPVDYPLFHKFRDQTFFEMELENAPI